MNHAKLQLILSLVSMFQALMFGKFRLMNTHMIDVHSCILTILFSPYLNIMVFGFLTHIILTESMVGSKKLRISSMQNLTSNLIVSLT